LRKIRPAIRSTCSNRWLNPRSGGLGCLVLSFA
jgi:hypothetical protein